jgi:hypothetical protein
MTRIDPAGRARFCDSCERPVYDSQAMTRGELADLIARHEGRGLPCVRLHRRPDGTIVTRDCFAPFRRAGHFLWLKVALGAVAFWAWALGLRPLALSVIRYREAREAEMEIADRTEVYAGLIRRSPPDRGRLADWPTIPRPSHIPSLRIDPLLPEVDRAPPLRYLEVDESVHKRLEAPRPPVPLELIE